MKILQVSKYYYPYRGGIETVVQNISEGLQKKGDEVTVICASLSNQSSEEMIHGVKVIRLSTWFSIYSQPISPQFILKLGRIARDFDLIHIHSPNPLIEFLLLFKKHLPPIFVTYHSDIVRQKWILPFYRPFLHLFLRKTQRIIVPTEFHITHSPILPSHENKCRIIPFGIDAKRFELDPLRKEKVDQLKSKYGKFILFVGRLVPYKGVAYLLEAIQAIPIHLLIVGVGPLKEELENEVRKLGIMSKVTFLGHVEDNELALLYQACEFLVLPSVNRSEAFGMVLIEAMACKKPVITTRLTSGVNFVSHDQVTGLQVNPMNASELSHAILEVLSSPELKESMGRESYKRFNEYFTCEKMIESYRLTYLSILGDRAEVSLK